MMDTESALVPFVGDAPATNSTTGPRMPSTPRPDVIRVILADDFRIRRFPKLLRFSARN